MAQNYTRQSSFADGDTITAALFNDEYNQLVNTFAYSSTSAASTGHRHDGTAGEGGNIPQIGDLDFNNKIVVDDTNNRWGFFVEVSSAAVEQIRIQDGAIVPVTDNDIDLGSASLEFKNLYIDGTATIDDLTVDASAVIGSTLNVSGTTTLSGDVTLGDASTDTLVINALVNSNFVPETDSLWNLGSISLYWANAYIDAITTTGDITVGGNITVTGNATINGNLTFGNSDTDSITITADIASNLTPNTDDTYDIGSSTKEWRNLYIDGTANIDSLVADTADINAGTIDNTVIGGTTAVAGSFTTATATTGNITNVNATTVDTTNIEVTNIKAKDGTSAGSIADSTGIVTIASSVLTTTDINGGTIDATAIGSSTASTGAFTSITASTTLGVTGESTLASATVSDLTSGRVVLVGTAGSIEDSGNLTFDGSTLTVVGTADVDTLIIGTSTGVTAVDTDLSSVSASDDTLASAKAIKTYIDSQVTAQDLDFQGDAGGALSIDLDSETLTIAGGAGIDTTGATNTLTVAIDSTVTTLTGTQTLTNKTLTSPVLNTGVSGTAVLDDDTFATASDTTLATSESIKAYVDSQGSSTLDSLTDTNITAPADASLLFYDTDTAKWIDNVVSGDITIADTGVAAISSGVIVNDDVNASAAISVSKTALVDGTGLTLTGDTLSVDASQTQITAVGTIGTGTWQGTAIANAYVDNDLTISGGTVDNTVIGGTTAAAGTFTNLTASGTVSFPDNSISGDDIDGGTISNFASTGIDDNATSTAITIDSSQEVGIGVTAPQALFHARKSTAVAAELEVGRFETYLNSGTNGQQILKILENNLVSGSGGQYSRLESVFINSVGSTLDAGFEFGGNSAGSYMTIDSSGTVQFQNAIEEQQYSLTGTAIDPSNGTIQYKTLGANTTFTESLANGEYVTLMIDDGAGYTITWPTTTWVGGSAPTLATTGYNVIELWHVNGTLYGAFVGAA